MPTPIINTQVDAINSTLDTINSDLASLRTPMQTIATRLGNIPSKDETYAAFPTDTASGAIASFTDGADDIPVKSLIADVTPIQNLNGQSAPYPAGGGVNKIGANNVTNGTYNGNVDSTLTHGSASTTISGTNPISIVMSYGWQGTTFISDVLENGQSYVAEYKIGHSGSTNNVRATTYLIDADYVIKSRLRNVQYGGTYSDTFTTSESGLRFAIYVSATDAQTLTLTDLYLHLSSVTASWSPYSNICPIIGHTECEVSRAGKNLVPTTVNVVQNKYRDDNGVETASNGSMYTTSFIAVKPSTKYTFKYDYTSPFNGMRIYYLTSTGEWISRTSLIPSTQPQTTFTTPANCGSIQFQFSITNKLNLEGVGLYLNEGQSYVGGDRATTYPISFGQTVYGGTLDVLTGVLTVTHGMRVLNGTETWYALSVSNYYGLASNQNAFMNDFMVYGDGTGFAGRPKISHFDGIPYTSGANVPDMSATSFAGANGKTLTVKDSNIASADAMKAFCLAQYNAGTPLTFVLPLATPTTIQLTAQNVKTLLGDNNIWADSGNVDVVIRADTAKYIANQIANALNS